MAWWEAELRGRRHALSRNAFLQATSSELGALLVFLVALQQIAACWTSNGASEHHEGRSGDPYQRNGRSSGPKAGGPVFRVM